MGPGIDIIHLDRDWKRARRPIDFTLCWAGSMQVAVSWPMLKEFTVYDGSGIHAMVSLVLS